MPVLEDTRGKYFRYVHIVGFQDTNLLGNVYYANYVAWQGRCREMFLREYAPDVVALFKEGLSLVTCQVACEYLNELFSFDEIAIRMRLGWLRQNRMLLEFEYMRESGESPVLVARGEQVVASMHWDGKHLTARPFPESMLQSLRTLQVLGGERTEWRR